MHLTLIENYWEIEVTKYKQCQQSFKSWETDEPGRSEKPLLTGMVVFLPDVER